MDNTFELKLDKLAEDASYEAYQTDEYDNASLRQGYYRGFKDGYREAMEHLIKKIMITL